MNSDGERLDFYLRVLRLAVDSGLSVDEALTASSGLIPAEAHAGVLRAYADQASTTIEVLGPGVLAAGGPRPWFESHNPSDGYYWRRQRHFLAHDLGRRDFEIDSLDQSTNRILAHMEDPHSPNGFAVRGLVVGHVQSGKTQNFSALIAKSADAGYKIVIVLSGLHNSLRRQTQLRLERDLGREHVQGVGEPEAGRRWQWMTGPGLHEDFPRAAFNAAVLQGNEQVILVVKKNKSRLEWLNSWVKGRVPEDVAVLVVDDEADQATVNTGGNRTRVLASEDAVEEETDFLPDGTDYDGDVPAADETSPTAINRNIRELVNQFHRCAYVAYTATPFANVLVNPEAFDREVGEDLYPRDFIVTLPDPPGDQYVGAARLFGPAAVNPQTSDEHEGLDVVAFVPEEEVGALVPARRGDPDFAPSLPPSLRQALIDYVLASAARLHRAGSDQPCTMLIHAHMSRVSQNALEPLVDEELARIRQSWLYDGENYRPLLRARWEQEFVPVTASLDVDLVVDFETIEPHVERFLRGGVETRVLNSDHVDELDFELEPNLKAVVIGGNKLSRGLTVEGLLVSYYVRLTLYYDTLLQMARWFGYRGSYVDLTRLYSTRDLVSYFHDLATAEADLRSQIHRYERERLTPTDFVVRVRKHAVMKITQPNKMQDAVDNNLSYSGELVQTLRVAEALPNGQLRESDRSALEANLRAARTLFGRLGAPTQNARRPMWSDVRPQHVIEFVKSFSLNKERKFDQLTLVDYIEAQVQRGELVTWRVLLSCNQQRPGLSDFWTEDLGVESLPAVPLISRTRMKQDPTSMGVVTNPEDELVGLDEEAVAAARDIAKDDPGRGVSVRYRELRDPREGLLIVYPVSPASTPDTRRTTNRLPLFEIPDEVPTVVQYALSFPFSRSAATIEYVSAPTPEHR